MEPWGAIYLLIQKYFPYYCNLSSHQAFAPSFARESCYHPDLMQEFTPSVEFESLAPG